MKLKSLLLTFIVLVSFSCEPGNDRSFENRKGVITDQAMVVCAHPLATHVGVEVMRKGGNAVDAAVAVHFALAVVYPAAGNIGGGGFLVYRTNESEFHTLDYREKAPAMANRDMYLDSLGNVDNSLSRHGHLAAGVPGSVDGLFTAHEKFGSMPWNELLAPAIELANNGFPLTAREARRLNRVRERLLEVNTIVPENLIMDQWNEDDTIKYELLASTLSRIAEQGPSGFYSGETARLIVEEMGRGNGLITYTDLENYESVWREPIHFSYKDYQVTSMGPPSSGGVALAQLMTMANEYPLAEWGIDNVKTIHTIAEVEKRVFADRATYLGDPDFTEVPVVQLIDLSYNLERAADIDPNNTTSSEDIFAGEMMVEHEQTTHFSIVDPFGNAVSSTTTLNGGFGSAVVVGGAGFFLNNEMDDFSAKPGSPNMYGLVGGEANSIAPGKRMLSSMTPTIVEKNGALHMILGTPGGSTIITSVFQTILNVTEFGLNMQGAVDFPRFHHQWKPDIIQHEPGRMLPNVREGLIDRGHELKIRTSIGQVDAILILDNGQLEGGADSRGDDLAAGF